MRIINMYNKFILGWHVMHKKKVQTLELIYFYLYYVSCRFVYFPSNFNSFFVNIYIF